MTISRLNDGWFKSSYSGNEPSCVETTVAFLSEKQVPVRDSKDITLPHLMFSTEAFASFVGDVKKGSFGAI